MYSSHETSHKYSDRGSCRTDEFGNPISRMCKSCVTIHDHPPVSDGNCQLLQMSRYESRRSYGSLASNESCFEGFWWKVEGFRWVAWTSTYWKLTVCRSISENIGGEGNALCWLGFVRSIWWNIDESHMFCEAAPQWHWWTSMLHSR